MKIVFAALTTVAAATAFTVGTASGKPGNGLRPTGPGKPPAARRAPGMGARGISTAALNTAAAVTRTALGDRNAASDMSVYPVSPFGSQHPWDHVDGAPFGTRGGIVVDHTFPADATYLVRINVEGGVGTRLEDLDVSI